MKSILTGLTDGLESLKYQTKRDLFNALNGAVEQLRTGKAFMPVFRKNVAEIIERHTGLRFDVYNINESYDNASACWYFLAPVHAFDDSAYYSPSEVGSVIKKVLASLKETSGYIDAVSGKVTGVFSEIVSELRMTDGLLLGKNGDNFIADTEEVSATILHEVGHVWTYYYYLNRSARFNAAITVMREEWLKLTDNNDRTNFINAFADESIKLQLETLPEPTAQKAGAGKTQILVKDGDDSRLNIQLAAIVNNVYRSETGNYYFDGESIESMADQFASRHGAGFWLAKNLHRNMKLYSLSNFGRVVVNIISVVSFIHPLILPLLLLSGAIGSAGARVSQFSHSTYPRNKDRLAKIRNDAIQIIKQNPSLPKEDIARMAEEIKAMDAFSNDFTNNRMVYEWVSELLAFTIKSQRDQYEYQRLLEDIAANKLFVKAAQLRTLV